MDKEFWLKLAKDNPNGVSFEPLALRLWHKRAGVDFGSAESLLSPHMLKLGKSWFCRPMLAPEETWTALDGWIGQNLEQYGFFSAGSFLRRVRSDMPKIKTESDAAALLEFMGYELADYQGRKFCVAEDYSPALAGFISDDVFEFLAPDDRLATILEGLRDNLSRRLRENGEIWIDDLLREDLPNLDAEALETIRNLLLPQAHAQDIDGRTVWSLPEAICLPEDFSEKITYVIDVWSKLKRGLGAATLGDSLNILYGLDFREEYGLTDNALFLEQCANAYAGQEYLRTDLAYGRLTRRSGERRRKRRKDTNFQDLGIPPGSVLRFVRDPSQICETEDGTSRVRYGGEVMYISTLAQRLLNISDGANGFREFSYDGETLDKRRQRLEREGGEKPAPVPRQADIIVRRKHPSAADSGDSAPEDNLARDENGDLILGLSGRPLTKSFWRDVLRAPRIAGIENWYHRYVKGESYEDIAPATPYGADYLHKLLFLYKVYLKTTRSD
ncbi:MAG: hypothetical protein K2H64_12890 [Desulfovibrio sp.]|nr:hypothetical protein [Desulfovibrio sp.]